MSAIKLNQIRDLAGLSQGIVADRLGVTQPLISKLERHKDVRLSMLAAYLDAVGAEAELVVRVSGQTLTYPIGGGSS
jgi:predicted transcriptional regulator